MQVSIQPSTLMEVELRKGLIRAHRTGLDRSLTSPLRLLFLAPHGAPLPSRLALPAEALATLGHHSTLARDFPLESLSEFDAILAHCPHYDPSLVEGLAACADAGIPVLLNLDANFEAMPLDHPGYLTLGLGTLELSKAYAASLSIAEKICVPNSILGETFKANGYPVHVIPDGWSRGNPLWKKQPSPRYALNLGWLGSPGQLEDLAVIRRIVLRLLREFPQVRLILSGDSRAYPLFEGVPESRRLYLPPVIDEDYPYLLGQLDIFLAPLRNTPFNRSSSDRWLVEAGARGIPWVASSSPTAIEWGAGGLLADSLDKWHAHLKRLIIDEDDRLALGQAGRLKAGEREMSHLVYDWLELFYSVVSREPVAGP